MNIRKFSIKTIQKGMKSEFYNFFFYHKQQVKPIAFKSFYSLQAKTFGFVGLVFAKMQHTHLFNHNTRNNNSLIKKFLDLF